MHFEPLRLFYQGERKMSFFSKERFKFSSQGLPEDSFGVIQFRGVEGLSTCYRFEIDLVSSRDDLDLGRALKKPAVFSIIADEGTVPIGGIIARLEQRQTFKEYTFYRVVLTPRLHRLTLTRHNQVFLDKGLPEILAAVLEEGGLTSLDYELRLQKSYTPWEYVCQYGESHFQFISRWMERDGLYYFFDQTEGGERLIITDSNLAHQPSPLSWTPPLASWSGLDENRQGESIRSFILGQNILPKQVLLKDYNYRTPSLEITGRGLVDPEGSGEVYLYGDHLRTPEEASRLAEVRAQELNCRGTVFHGESGVPYLRPGFLFKILDHDRPAFNRQYLTLGVTHEGSQAAYLIDGIKPGWGQESREVFYRNSFSAIPSDRQFRPERKTEKARFYGTMNAVVDAAGGGRNAELDDQGRYKVQVPLDLSGSGGGKASAWLRLMQPYAGSDHGMHFPLHKGAEVLLIFVEGDPDRPIIAGAAPNPNNPSVIDSGNETQCAIQSSGGNQLVFSDKEGREYVGLWSPYHNTGLAMGSVKDGGGGSFHKWTFGDDESMTFGNAFSSTVGIKNTVDLGLQNSFRLGAAMGLNIGSSNTINLNQTVNWNHGDSITLGAGRAMNIKPRAHFGAMTEITLAGGVDPAQNAIQGKAQIAVALAAAGGASSLSGGIMADQAAKTLWSDTGVKKFKNKDWGLGVTGAVLSVGGFSLAAAAYKVMHHAADLYSRAAKAGLITLNAQGVDIKAEKPSALAPDPMVKLSVAVRPPARESSIEISPGGGRISLNNNGTSAVVTLDQGNTITLELSNATKIVLSRGTVVIEKPNSAKITVGTTITIEKSNGGKIQVAGGLTQMSVGNNMVKVSNTEIVMKIGGNFFKVDPVGATVSGTLVRLG
ncbi:MAG: type VI secretion system tip protein TssI/VgrG [Pseudomonadota bacterium]